MTKQHKATPDDWAQQEDWANRSAFSDSSCIIELRDRIEALEAGQQPPQDKLDRLIALDRDDSTNSLVDRIATDAELCKVYNDAPKNGFGMSLRAVYDLGRQHGAAPIRPGPESAPAGSPVERSPECIANWPGCYEGGYNPSCCRFPKSCSCEVRQEVQTASSLVNRIKRRLIKGVGGTSDQASCDVIREVAAWLKEKGYNTLQAEALEQEANRG